MEEIEERELQEELKEIEEGMEKLEKEFMKPEVIFGEWVEYEEDGECFIVPAEFFEGGRDEYELRTGWGSRLSASGYLDCTDWCVYDTEHEAKLELVRLYAQE